MPLARASAARRRNVANQTLVLQADEYGIRHGEVVMSGTLGIERRTASSLIKSPGARRVASQKRQFFVSVTSDEVSIAYDQGEKPVEKILVEEVIGLASYDPGGEQQFEKTLTFTLLDNGQEHDEDEPPDPVAKDRAANRQKAEKHAKKMEQLEQKMEAKLTALEDKEARRIGKLVRKVQRRLLRARALRVWREGEADTDAASWANRLKRFQTGHAQMATDECSSNRLFWRAGAGFVAERARALELRLSYGEFALLTSPVGTLRGCCYICQAASHDELDRWVEVMCRAVAASAKRKPGPPRPASVLQIVRARTHAIYAGDVVQVVVAAMILSNFLVNLAEAQVPATDESTALFGAIDLGFTAVFALELLVNLFANLWTAFVSDAWNFFDVLVVTVSLVSIFVPALPGADLMRLMRCFRVFRLFKRIPSFRNIIVSLAASVAPMCNAFFIVCLVLALYSVVGVSLFGGAAPDLFGSLLPATFSLFQSMTGDGWSDHCRQVGAAIAPGARGALGATAFYVSYVILVGMVLINVVMAVLLDAFAAASAVSAAAGAGGEAEVGTEGDELDPDEREAADKFRPQVLQVELPLHRITKELSRLGLASDVNRKVEKLFEDIALAGLSRAVGAVDPRLGQAEAAGMEALKKEVVLLKRALRIWRQGPVVSWTLSADEFRLGLRGLPYMPPVTLSAAAFDRFVSRAGFTDGHGNVSVSGFRRLVAAHMSRELMYNLAKCDWQCRVLGRQWCSSSIEAVSLALMALCRLANDGAPRGNHLPVTSCGGKAAGGEMAAAATGAGVAVEPAAEDEIGEEIDKAVRKLAGGLKHMEERMGQLVEALDCMRAMQRRRARLVFDEFDFDGSGEWEISEFEVFCEEFELCSTAAAQRAFVSIDKDGGGTIDFEEFAHWFARNVA